MNINLHEGLKWVELFFGGNVDFGRKSVVGITRNGSGLEQLVLNFTFPKLPEGVIYKNFTIYDVIEEVELIIGDNTSIFKFNSTQLKMFDQAERNYSALLKCSSMTNNKMIYPISLHHFFDEAFSAIHILIPDLICDLPLNYDCLRLIDLDLHEVKFYIKLKQINDNIDKYILGTASTLKLELTDLTMLACYRDFYDETLPPYSVETKEYTSSYFSQLSNLLYGPQEDMQEYTIKKQDIKLPKITQQQFGWVSDTETIPKGSLNFKYKFYNPKTDITKIILHSELLSKVKYLELQVNGKSITDKIDPVVYKKIYTYNEDIELDDNTFVFNVEILLCVKYILEKDLKPVFEDQNIVLCVTLNDCETDFKFDCMYDQFYTGVYENGMYRNDLNITE